VNGRVGWLAAAVVAVEAELDGAGSVEVWAGALAAGPAELVGAGALLAGALATGAGVVGGAWEAVGVVLPASGSMYC
jgi:hypothetical protein